MSSSKRTSSRKSVFGFWSPNTHERTTRTHSLGMTRTEVLLAVLLFFLLLLGPAAHSWFEWRLTRDVRVTQSAVESRLVALEGFVESRKDVAPKDVLAWLREHSVPCPDDCPPCSPQEDLEPDSDAPIDQGS